MNHTGAYSGERRPLKHGILLVVVSLAGPVVGCGDGAPGGDTTGDPQELQAQGGLRAPAFGEPLRGLTRDALARFQAGRDTFAEVEDESDGLGPVFNNTSCGACHAHPALGGSDSTVETRFGVAGPGGFDPLPALGGSLIQTTGIARTSPGCPSQSIAGEAVPAQANVIAGRRTTPLFGLGLVDAVPDDTLVRLAAAQARDPDGVRGVAAQVLDLASGRTRVGRFGWKAQNPSLSQFAADAYLNEMGITSTLFPVDLCPQGSCTLRECDLVPGIEDQGGDVAKFTDFMTLLAPPPPGRPTFDDTGARAFQRAGCATCHVPTLVTGPDRVAALDRVAFHPYSDFLLHDMGSLGDGIAQAGAGPRQMRTAPLWGVASQAILLHDGRAQGVDQAVRAHDGEALAARRRYLALDARTRAALIDFVQRL